MTSQVGGVNQYDAASTIIHFLASPKAGQKLDALSPVMILAFDEAYQLTKVHGNAEKSWLRFGKLRCNI